MMKGKTTTVYVDTSFETGKKLFSIIEKYAKSSDGKFAYWDEFAFTVEKPDVCDALLIFNNPRRAISINTDPERMIAFMMEPGVRAIHPWMFAGLDQYSAVYSPLAGSSNSVPSHGFLGWHPDYNWEYLSDLKVPEKTEIISCICSDLKNLEGHKLRNGFITVLKKEIPGIHFFGRGSNFLPDKFDGLMPYKYSIALENTSIQHYFTEKINDCFLAWTVPIYFGCRNIGKYFPEKAFIPVDINNPLQAIKKIRTVIDNDDWSGRINAVKEARDLVLNHYQPLAGAAEIIRQLPSAEKKEVAIKPVPESISRKMKSVLAGIRQNMMPNR